MTDNNTKVDTPNNINKTINSDQSNHTSDHILFESLVDNEKEYLKNILLGDIFQNQNNYNYPCSVFCNWIVTQFDTIKILAPSPVLIYNLEFLNNHSNINNININSDQDYESKQEEYYNNIIQGTEQDYNSNLNINSLIYASKRYIKTHVTFFNNQLIQKVNEVYQENSKNEDREFLIERLPFLLANRTVFKLVKGIVSKSENFIDFWYDSVIPQEINENKRIEVFKDLLNTDFDYVPLRFYS